jgi:hypothetical protein
MNSYITNIFSKSLHIVGAVAIGVVLGAGVHTVFGWTNPTGTPPNGNVSAPLTTSVEPQTKAGNLIINNTGTSALGLVVKNGALAVGTTTATSSLKMVVAGKVGAQQYCDVNGNNCVSAPGGGGGGGNGIGGPTPRWHDVADQRKFSHIDAPATRIEVVGTTTVVVPTGKQNVYRNDRGYPIIVSASTYSGVLGVTCSIFFTIDGVERMGWNFSHGNPGAAICHSSMVIPAGSTYQVSSLTWSAVAGTSNLGWCTTMVEGKQVCGGRKMYSWNELYTD